MPSLPDNPDANRKISAISGTAWDDAIDYMQRITPRGDGETTFAEVTKYGTKLKPISSPQENGGGASLESLPGKTERIGPSLVTGKAWNKMLDYLQMITPITEGDGIASKSLGEGFEISFPPPEELFCPDFPFYFNITITGPSNTFPVTWLGQTWEESGETKAICGTGTQSANGQTWDAFVPSFGLNFGGSTTEVTGAAAKQGRFHNIGMVLPTATTSYYPWRRQATYVHYTTDFGYYTTTRTTSASSTSSYQGLVTAYTPPVGSSPYPWNGTENANRILPEMNGSVTTTIDRTISWEAVPDTPWDYPAP